MGGSSCQGGKEAPISDRESRSREESSRIGEGTDVEIGGTIKVSSLDFALGLTDVFFCFRSALAVEEDEPVSAFLVSAFFLDFSAGLAV